MADLASKTETNNWRVRFTGGTERESIIYVFVTSWLTKQMALFFTKSASFGVSEKIHRANVNMYKFGKFASNEKRKLHFLWILLCPLHFFALFYSKHGLIDSYIILTSVISLGFSLRYLTASNLSSEHFPEWFSGSSIESSSKLN